MMAEAREKEQQGCKMFIGGLTSDTTKEMLEEHYGHWGEIIDAVVMVDSVTRKSRGFGFVTYNERESVDECIKAGPHKIDNKTVETKRAVPRDSCTPEVLAKTKKVFLGGLHLDTTEDDIREFMEPFGEIEDIAIIREKGSKKPRGFGFITFKDYDSADKLCGTKHIRIRDRDVEAKKAQSVDEMNRQRDYNERYVSRRSDRRPGGGYLPPPSHNQSRDNRYMPPPPHHHPPPHHGYSYPPNYPPNYPPPQHSRYSDYYPHAPHPGGPPYQYGSYETAAGGYSGPPAGSYERSQNSTGYNYNNASYSSYDPPANHGYPPSTAAGSSNVGYQTYSGSATSNAMSSTPPSGSGPGSTGYMPRSQGGAAARSYHPYRRQCELIKGADNNSL